MASYLTQPSVAKIEPFKPNWDFLLKVASTAQQRYDTNLARIEGLYGTLLNSEMSNEANIQRRDEYFKQAQNQINKIASMDLAMPNVVEQATNVFNPILDDEYIPYDMQWTKLYNSQLSTAQRYRDSADPAQRSKYWEAGVRELDILKQKFKSAPVDQIKTIGTPRYTEKVDIYARANEIVKQQFGSDAMIMPSKQGGYLIHTSNGPIAYGPYKMAISAALQGDPAVSAMYRTMYNVGEHDFVTQNMGAYGNEDAAKLAYAEQVISENEELVQRDFFGNLVASRQQLKQDLEGHEAVMSKDGIVPGSDEHTEYLRKIRALAGLDNQEQSETVRSIVTPASNVAEMRNKALSTFYLNNLNSQVENAARAQAYKGYQVKMEEDQFALNQQKFSFDQQMKQLEFRLGIQKGYLEHLWKMDEKAAESSASTSGLNLNSLVGSATGAQTLYDVPGALSTTEMPAGFLNEESLTNYEKQILSDEALYLQNYNRALGREAVEFNGQAVAFKDLAGLLSTPEGRSFIMNAYTEAHKNSSSNPAIKNNSDLMLLRSKIQRNVSTYSKVADEVDQADANIWNSWISQESNNAKLRNATAGFAFINQQTGRPVSLSQYISAYARAEGESAQEVAEDATEEYNKILKNYTEHYNKYMTTSARTKLFGGVEGMGAGSASFPGYSTVFNGQALNPDAAKMMNEMATTLSAARRSGNAVFQVGNLGTIGSNDPQMADVYQRVVNDIIARQGKDASGAPIFSLQYQSVAGDDPSKAGYTITLDSEYAKKWIGDPKTGALIDEESDFAKSLQFSISFDKDFDQSSYRYSNQKVDGVEATMRQNPMGTYYQDGPYGSSLYMRELLDGSVEVTQSLGAVDPATGRVVVNRSSQLFGQMMPGNYESILNQWEANVQAASKINEQVERVFKGNNGAVKDKGSLVQ